MGLLSLKNWSQDRTELQPSLNKQGSIMDEPQCKRETVAINNPYNGVSSEMLHPIQGMLGWPDRFVLCPKGLCVSKVSYLGK